LNLDCPGCKSRLKIDSAKLPPGATTAVCPKCRTKILLPGAAPSSSDISVQCPACSARLKVNVSRLKPGVSQSKCPKCGGAVTLPAAPAARPPAPEVPASAQTRRLDPREMGMMLGASGSSATASGSAGGSAPIAVEEVTEQSDLDLGRLIDQKVNRLGGESQGRPVPQSRPLRDPGPRQETTQPTSAKRLSPDEMPSIPLASPAAGRPSAPGGEAPPPPPRPRESGVRSAPGEAARKGSDAGSHPAPKVQGEAASAAPPRESSGAVPMLIGGIVAGAILGLTLAFAGGFFPAVAIPHVPEALASVAGGEKLPLVIVVIVLSGLAGLFGGRAKPPALGSSIGDSEARTTGGGVSVFRCIVAAGLMGLIAGIAFSLAEGGFNLVLTLGWTLWMALSGLLTAPLASILSRK